MTTLPTHPHELAKLIRDGHATLVRPKHDWLCTACRSTYAEYINGCPRCWQDICIVQHLPDEPPHPPGSEVVCEAGGPRTNAEGWDAITGATRTVPATVTAARAVRVAELTEDDVRAMGLELRPWEVDRHTGELTGPRTAALAEWWTTAYPEHPFADAWAWAYEVEAKCWPVSECEAVKERE